MTTSKILQLMDNTNAKFINDKRLNGVYCNSAFLCKTSSETERLDWRRDGMGTWSEGKRFTKMPYTAVSVTTHTSLNFDLSFC